MSRRGGRATGLGVTAAARRSGVPPVFGVVAFEGGDQRRVTETVVVFSSSAAADDYAKAEGLADYEVTPLRLAVVDSSASVVGQGLHPADGADGPQ